ncbi:MAG TPA: hypothetical protein VFV53_03000 [Candidatus Limnocylindrales bacterium]|nr:hypothetical protein [Candidatus Limnocylindrales bacterium]
MSKVAVTRLFVAAVALVVAGAAIGIVAVVVALANGAVAFGGPQIVTVNGGPVAGAVAALIVASLVAGAGAIAAIAAWLGALWNTWQLEDKTWFTTLLVLGVVSLGWVAMVAYLLRGPDSTAPRAVQFGDAAPAGADRS